MASNEKEPTQPLWEKEYIKSLGQDLLNKTIKYLNNELSFPEYEAIRRAHNDRFLPFTDAQRRNYEKMMIYDDTMQMLINLHIEYENRLHDFSEKNSDLVYVLQLVLLAEMQIKGENEYNLLLSAIPEEAKQQMNKDIIKPKPVTESINTLASLNFAIEREKRGTTENALSGLLYHPTALFCELKAIELIYNVVCKMYGVKEKLLLKEPIKNDTYLYVCKNIRHLEQIGNVRIPKYKNTLFYKRLHKYLNIQDILDIEEYKEAEKEATKHIKEYIKHSIKTNDKGLLLLDEIMNILFKQGWWFIV